MITFRSKQLIQDLMPKALEHLSQKGIRPNIITRDQADEVSKVNSRAMVIISFIKNENGYYQIQVQDKSLVGHGGLISLVVYGGELKTLGHGLRK